MTRNDYRYYMNTADFVIDAGVVVTVDAKDRVLPDHSLVIRDGLIADLLPTSESTRYQSAQVVDCRDQIVLPGLVNAHTHLAMNLLRGFADDLPLMQWLEQHIWPAEMQWVSPEFVSVGTELALAESLLGGVTCVNDMYFYPDMAAKAAEKSGIRATLGLIVLDFPSAWARSVDEYLQKGLGLHDELRDKSRLQTAFAPHAPYTVSQETLQRVATIAAEIEIPIHIHVHETAAEVSNYLATHGQRPLQALHAINLLSPSLLAVHMTQLDTHDIELVAKTGMHVLHCPESNMKLASGACPVDALLSHNVNVALGTDGAASNNDLDMFGEMRTAAMLAKHCSGDASALPATQALRMATQSGAEALGLGEKIGSIEVGKAADCVSVTCDNLFMSPMYDPVSHLVYCCDRSNVANVWIAGERIVNDGRLLTLDTDLLRVQATSWANKLKAGN